MVISERPQPRMAGSVSICFSQPRMAGRRRERLKIVRPTCRYGLVGVSLDNVFFFFCCCSSSRCFLESPSALPRLLPDILAATQSSDTALSLARKSPEATPIQVASWRRGADVRHTYGVSATTDPQAHGIARSLLSQAGDGSLFRPRIRAVLRLHFSLTSPSLISQLPAWAVRVGAAKMPMDCRPPH